MNFSKKNHEQKKTNIFFVSKTFKLKFSKSIAFLMCIVFTALIISCNNSQKPDQENEEPSKELLSHLIKLDDAVVMYKNYEEQRIAITKDTLQKLYNDNKFEDTRTVWFDLKTIKDYIAFVEKKSAENHIKPDGLKFYFSVYPNNKGLGDEKNHQTFFIAPTTNNNENLRSGYTLVGEGDKEKVIYLKDVLNNKRNQTQQNRKVNKASFFTTTVLVENEGLVLNVGTGSPPHDVE
ncbi:MAG: hypothetical protein L3J20_08095 [Flavobacteriaceae bacterium]|nr:hypothetical protein [Flavobacteriaceae bacterium]